MPVAVNLSARQFRQRDLDRASATWSTRTASTPGLIELEITESHLMQDPEVAMRAHGEPERGGRAHRDRRSTEASWTSSLQDALGLALGFNTGAGAHLAAARSASSMMLSIFRDASVIDDFSCEPAEGLSTIPPLDLDGARADVAEKGAGVIDAEVLVQKFFDLLAA